MDKKVLVNRAYSKAKLLEVGAVDDLGILPELLRDLGNYIENSPLVEQLSTELQRRNTFIQEYAMRAALTPYKEYHEDLQETRLTYPEQDNAIKFAEEMYGRLKAKGYF